MIMMNYLMSETSWVMRPGYIKNDNIKFNDNKVMLTVELSWL